MRTAREVYAMVKNESLWQAAARCHEVLAAAEIPHAVMGGVAVCLYKSLRQAYRQLVRQSRGET